jgi:hypothetical protein
MGFDEPCFQDSDESWRARPSSPAIDFERCARGWCRCRCPTRRLPTVGFPTPDGKVHAAAAGTGRARLRAQPRCARATPALAAALPAGDDLAAGAALPQQQLRQRASLRASSASRCSRCTPRTPRRAASPTARWSRVFNDARPLPLQGRGQRPRAARRGQRPGGLVAQVRRRRHQRQRADHQRLTDIGRRPPSTTAWSRCCRCEALAHEGRAGAGLGAAVLAGRRRLPGQRLQHAWATTRRPLATWSPCCKARARSPTGWPIRGPRAAAARAAASWRSACATSPCRAGCPTTQLPPLRRLAAARWCGTWWPRPSCR